MRVVVMSDRIGALSSAEAGAVLAAGWSDAVTQVVPVGASGAGFCQALADQLGQALETVARSGGVLSVATGAEAALVAWDSLNGPEGAIAVDASSVELGLAVRDVLRDTTGNPQRVIVDLSGQRAHDGGAGFLAGLGAIANVALDRGVGALGHLSSIDTRPSRQLIGESELIGVVPQEEAEQLLIGLRGITSLRGRPAGMDPAALLSTDAALKNLAGLLQVPDQPGVGACGGLGLAILSLGGRLSTGPQLAFTAPEVAKAVRTADLLVTGCAVFDFGTRGGGGGVVAEVAALAEGSLIPCIAVSGEVLIGAREMRTLGIESAYAVRESTLGAPTGGDVSREELQAVATRVASSWQW